MGKYKDQYIYTRNRRIMVDAAFRLLKTSG